MILDRSVNCRRKISSDITQSNRRYSFQIQPRYNTHFNVGIIYVEWMTSIGLYNVGTYFSSTVMQIFLKMTNHCSILTAVAVVWNIRANNSTLFRNNVTCYVPHLEWMINECSLLLHNKMYVVQEKLLIRCQTLGNILNKWNKTFDEGKWAHELHLAGVML